MSLQHVIAAWKKRIGAPMVRFALQQKELCQLRGRPLRSLLGRQSYLGGKAIWAE
jgi:hypothetical protein